MVNIAEDYTEKQLFATDNQQLSGLIPDSGQREQPIFPVDPRYQSNFFRLDVLVAIVPPGSISKESFRCQSTVK